MSDIVDALLTAVVRASETILREHGAVPQPQVHMVCDWMEQPYMGHILCRPFYRGADAASAIANLGLLPSDLMATRLIVAWEDCDLRTALDMPGESFATGVVVLDARLAEGHTLHWHPFDVEVGGVSPYGVPTVIPHWRTPARFENVGLLAPIAALLEMWRELRGEELDQTEAALRDAGYEVKWASLQG